jgi:hypothetical protein
MPTFKNITGLRFERWIALERQGRRWLCRCDCGAEAFVRRRDLEIGHSKSCGCLNRELSAARCAARNTTHGLWRSTTHRAWMHMLDRCNNPKHPSFNRYGGRGVKVRYPSVEAIVADMGDCPPGHDCHRLDNDGDYEPGNCTWLPRSEHRRLHRSRAK